MPDADAALLFERLLAGRGGRWPALDLSPRGGALLRVCLNGYVSVYSVHYVKESLKLKKKKEQVRECHC